MATMKVSLLQNNIWQMQPRGRWQEISAPFRWFLRSAFPCQEAESLMQKNPAMPRETLGEFSKHNCMLFFNELQAYFHAKTRPAAGSARPIRSAVSRRAQPGVSRLSPPSENSHPKGWLFFRFPNSRFCFFSIHTGHPFS